MNTEDEKFINIRAAARELFWKHGIKRVSVEEICEVAGVSKMTFYKHFRNKTELAVYLLEELFNEGLQAYREIRDSEASYEEKALKIIDLKMHNMHGISQELLNDIYKYKDEELSKTVESIKNRMLDIYMEDFREEQKKGNLRPDIKPEFILYMLNKTTEIITDTELTNLYPSTEDMLSDILGFYFYGFLSDRKRIRP